MRRSCDRLEAELPLTFFRVPSGELRVRGTNQGRTEPTFTIDTRAGSLTIERTSGQDAFRLEARVESLRPGD